MAGQDKFAGGLEKTFAGRSDGGMRGITAVHY